MVLVNSFGEMQNKGIILREYNFYSHRNEMIWNFFIFLEEKY